MKNTAYQKSKARKMAAVYEEFMALTEAPEASKVEAREKVMKRHDIGSPATFYKYVRLEIERRSAAGN